MYYPFMFILITFHQRYPNLIFLKPLSDWMTAQKPEDRPTAERALEELEGIIKAERRVKLRWRLCRPNETRKQQIFADTSVVIREIRYQVSNLVCTYLRTKHIILLAHELYQRFCCTLYP